MNCSACRAELRRKRCAPLTIAWRPPSIPPRRRSRAADCATLRDAVLRDLDLMLLFEMQPKLELQPDVELSPATPEPSPADDLVLSEAAPSARPTIDQLWELALSGREAEAYRGLMGLLETDATEGLYLRLFWLLTVMPDLDTQRSPVDWLVSGLQKCGLSGPLWELYRRALAEDAEEAQSQRCARLFGSGAGPDALIDLVQYRWRGRSHGAMGRAERRPGSAARACAGHGTADLGAAVVRGAGSADVVRCQGGAEPDKQRLPIAAQLAVQLRGDARSPAVRPSVAGIDQLLAGLRPEPAVSPPLLALIPLSWSRPFAEVRPQLLSFLAEALCTPRTLLIALDAAQEESLVVVQFASLLEHLQETLPPPPVETRSSRDLAELAFAVLDLADRSSYRNLRPALLEFCLREAIAPETLAELIAEVPAYALIGSGHLSNVVAPTSRCDLSTWHIDYSGRESSRFGCSGGSVPSRR